MFLKISQLNGPLQKKETDPNIHPQLIHTTLQGGLVIEDIYKIIHKVRKTTLEPSV
jgi:hypothetical protein